jgi:predicted N-acetyltransferase YhbS
MKNMCTDQILITQELACHIQDVEALNATAFGPGRFARTAFRLREGVEPERELSFVAAKDNRLVGSVRVTRISIGARTALILGPLVVDPLHKNEGIGGELMRTSVAACRKLNHQLIILVGDESYYKPFGFRKIPHGQIRLPGPVDPARFLYCELTDEVLANYCGLAQVFSNSD